MYWPEVISEMTKQWQTSNDIIDDQWWNIDIVAWLTEMTQILKEIEASIDDDNQAYRNDVMA